MSFVMRRLASLSRRVASVVLPGLMACGWVQAGVSYQNPTGGWTYIYDGVGVAADPIGALDGFWSHENGSDAWDGSGIGDIDAPGGASALSEGGVTYLRIEDTGDPRNDGFTDPSNRKIYFTRVIDNDDPDGTLLTDGVTITFRTRLPVSGLLDHEVGPQGDGYYVRDDGKSTFSIRQASGGIISFALSTSGGDDDAVNANGALVMNNYVPDGAGNQVDRGEAGEHVEHAVNDPTAWNEFWITIQANADEANQFDVNVYANGSTTPTKYLVTGGTGSEFGNSYIAIGQHSTAQSGAVDIDFYGFKPGVLVPTTVAGGIPGDFDNDGGLDVDDIDQLTVVVRAGTNVAKFDVTKDGQVNDSDRLEWVTKLKKTYLGDATLDGEFNSGDFVEVFQAGQYEDEVAGNSTWGTGDWDGDGDFTSGDFVAAFTSGGYELGPRAATQAVPEPASWLAMLGALSFLAVRQRR